MTAYEIQPMRDRVLVRRIEPLQTGRIFIPTSAREKPLLAEVLAIGPKVLEVQKGDTVLIGPYTDYEKNEFAIIQEADVRVIVHV